MRPERVCKPLCHNDNPRSAKDAFISRSFGWVVAVVGPSEDTDIWVVVGGGDEEHGAHRCSGIRTDTNSPSDCGPSAKVGDVVVF